MKALVIYGLGVGRMHARTHKSDFRKSGVQAAYAKFENTRSHTRFLILSSAIANDISVTLIIG